MKITSGQLIKICTFKILPHKLTKSHTELNKINILILLLQAIKKKANISFKEALQQKCKATFIRTNFDQVNIRIL